LQVGARATLLANDTVSLTGQTALLDNLYYDSSGNFQHRGNSAGAMVQMYQGNIIFQNSNQTSGTPTVTERLRVTSAGIIEGIGDISSYTNKQTVFAAYGDTDAGEYGIALNTSGDSLEGSITSNLKYSDGTITQLNTNRSSAEIKFANTTTSGSKSAIIFTHSTKGTTTQTEAMRIDYNGELKVPSVHSDTTSIGANVTVLSNGRILRSTSSLKYKTDVRDYDKGLNEVMQLQPKYYKGKNDESETQFAGLIAEDVHDLGLSEFVQYADDGSPDALSYTHMIALLTKGIQELKAEIETLKAQIN
jgi:hypothetical protein